MPIENLNLCELDFYPAADADEGLILFHNFYLKLVRNKQDCFINQKSFQTMLKDMLSNH